MRAKTTRQKTPHVNDKRRAATMGRNSVEQKRINSPPKDPQPLVLPEIQEGSCSISNIPLVSAVHQIPIKTDFTTVYQNDYQAWPITKCHPLKPCGSLKVSHGLIVPSSPTTDGACSQKSAAKLRTTAKVAPKTPESFGSISTYRAHYVVHPIPPRTCPRPKQSDHGPRIPT